MVGCKKLTTWKIIRTIFNFFFISYLDVLCCAGIVPSEWPFVRMVKTINDVDLKLNRDRRPKIQNAGVTKCDIIASNGIIHEINDVINAKQMLRSPPHRDEVDSHSDESAFFSTIPKRTFPNFFRL